MYNIYEFDIYILRIHLFIYIYIILLRISLFGYDKCLFYTFYKYLYIFFITN